MSYNVSERMANRLEKARQLDELLKGMQKMHQHHSADIQSMRDQFALCLEIDQEFTDSEQLKKGTIKEREHMYMHDEKGLMKRLSSINRFLMGKRTLATSTVELAQKHIRIIRGANNSKKSKTEDKTNNTMLQTESDAKGKDSTEHTGGFGNKLLALQRLLTLLSKLGPTYTPGNELAKINSLQKLYVQLEKLNRAVVLAKRRYAKARLASKIEGKKLMYCCSDIKNLMASTYGYQSQEYKQIKSVRYT
ncbi:MAG: hypothetical protein OIF50_06460 [Flavobacteriaceae bacterium]|nr:hypothetical protein [Flavobacteriaceae bacterium]